MKYRAYQFTNVNTMEPVYCIQARVGKNGWAHIYEHGRIVKYATPDERDAALKEMENE